MTLRKGFSFIGLIVAAAIILAVVMYMMNGTKKQEPDTLTDFSHSEKHTVYGKAMDAGNAVTCRSNIGNVRNAINMYFQSNEAAPPDLKTLNLPDSTTKCAVSGQPYTYDPRTGAVACPTHPEF
ncbi:MAG: hypothetical protein J5758_04420 [Abditibacteriota bacterium]|nr:hypothetical protein [Abditibacteriota bacterium]